MKKKAASERLQETNQAVRILKGGLTISTTIYHQGDVVYEPDKHLLSLAQEGTLAEFINQEGGDDA